MASARFIVSRRVVLPTGIAPAAVRIEAGRIAAVLAPDAVPAEAAAGGDVLDVGDAVLMPGVVDTHVHLNEPGRTEWEGFETATRAAAAGGITTVCDMPLNSIPVTTTAAALRTKVDAVSTHAWVDWALWGGVVPGNAPDLEALLAAGALGAKCFLVHSGIDEFPDVTEADLDLAMPILARHGAVLLVHAEVPGPIAAAEPAAATARPDGRYPDVACPEAAAASEGVAYALSAPDAMASATVGWLLNGHAVMLVYGRYYACDDLDGDIADMRAALGYLTTRADADPQHVAITGNSWGGFLALFGAVNAPPGLHLDAVVPMNPPSDFVDWLSYLDELATTWPRPADLAFFLSYKRRVLRASGGAPGVGDFTRFRHAAVCAGLGATPTLLLHDEWDTLIPIRQSQGLVTTCSRDGMWWPRQGTLDPLVVGLDHGLLGKEPGYPSVFTFAQVYLLARLNDAQHPIIALASRPAIASYLGLIHAEQVAGGQLGHALARLREAAGARIFFYIVDEMQTVEAAAVLAQGINTHWNTSYTAASLRTQLALGLPPL